MTHDPKKKAVCAVVVRDGMILGVSRKYDREDFGFPGGKVEPGESLETACIRELAEEAGLSGVIVKHIFTDYDAHDWLVSSFLVEASGEVSSQEEGAIKWCEPNELIDGTTFSEYNNNVLERIGYHHTKSEMQFDMARFMLGGFVFILIYIAALVWLLK